MAKADPRKIYSEAMALHRSGQLAAAEKKYREVLRMVPNVAEIHNSHGVALAGLGRPREALEAFRRVVRLDPENPQACNNYGNALKEQGMLDEAVLQYRKAVALRPDYAPAQYHLALTLKMMGETAAAKAVLQQLLAAQPSHVDARNSLGLLFKADNDTAEAIACFSAALEAAPDFVDARMNLGLAYAQSEQWELAIAQYYAVCNARPDFAEAFLQLGLALLQHRRYEDALETFAHALQLDSENVRSHIGRSNAMLALNRAQEAVAALEQTRLLPGAFPDVPLEIARAWQELGEHDRAVTVYQEMIAQSPDCVGAYLGLADTRKLRDADAGLVVQVETALQQSDLSPETETAICFALGKMHDDLKHYEAAFQYYARGNALRDAEQEAYIEQDYHEKVSAIIANFGAGFFSSHAGIGVENTQPVFVVGMPRSGTTLTEQIIASHPIAIGAGEVMFWTVADTALPVEIGTDIPYPECIGQLNAAVCHRIADRYLTELYKFSASSDAARIVDKMPHNFMALGLIAAVFPRAKIIHIKRDAMDNCLSIYFQSFGGRHPYAYDLAKLGHHYREYERLMLHWRSVLPADSILEIQYEQLVAKQEQVTRQMIEFIGLPWDDRCLTPQDTGKVIRTASIWQARQPVYKTSVQRWKNYEKYLGPLRDALGYQD